MGRNMEEENFIRKMDLFRKDIGETVNITQLVIINNKSFFISIDFASRKSRLIHKDGETYIG